MEKDFSEVANTGDIELIRMEIGKLAVQRGDVLVLRRCDGVAISRAEAAHVRETVLRAFEDAGFRPAVLFVDGFELAVIRGCQVSGGQVSGGEEVGNG